MARFRESVENATLADYDEVMEDRPYKLDQHAANYRKAQKSEPRCDECVHFFLQLVGGKTVCEIVRPVPEERIFPEWTCKFQSPDYEEFPLYKDGGDNAG